jgi:hypothetical protein
MHSISAGYRRSKGCARERPVFDQPSKSAPYSGCWTAWEDMKGHFAITLSSSRCNASKNAMRRPRSVLLAGQLLRHLHVEQGDAAFIGDCERPSPKGISSRLVAGLSRKRPRKRGEPCVSGRTATDCGYAVRSADLPFPPRRRAARSTLFTRRRAEPLRSGTIARELHAAPNHPRAPRHERRLEPTSPLEHSRRALAAE